MRNFIICISFLIISFSSFAQYDFYKEKGKYWVYRERIKNFVVSGDCKGSGIPANGRDNGIADKDHINDGMLGWSDSPWDIGYWMGTLAMEYDLLSSPAQNLRQNECLL